MPFRFLESWHTTIAKQFRGEKYFIRWLYALEAFANHLEKECKINCLISNTRIQIFRLSAMQKSESAMV